MCRVLLVSKNDFNLFDRKHGILALMNHLEKECGGHGNGYALIKDRTIIESRKGVKLSNGEIYGRIRKVRWDYLIYHTRINSVGGTNDANCHPFVVDNDCLAMNGTEYTLRTIAGAFNRTDTEIIFKNIVGAGLNDATKALGELSSVFIGCVGGLPFAVQAGGTLHKWNKGNCTLHASTLLPEAMPFGEKLPDGYQWKNGKEDRQLVKASKGYWRGSDYTRFTSYAGNDYDPDYYFNGIYREPCVSKATETKAVKLTELKKEEKPESSALPVIDTKASGSEKKKESPKQGKVIPMKEAGEYLRGYGEGFEEGYEEGYDDGRNSVEFTENNDFDKVTAKADPSSEYNIGFCDGRAVGQEEGYESAMSDHALAGVYTREFKGGCYDTSMED